MRRIIIASVLAVAPLSMVSLASAQEVVKTAPSTTETVTTTQAQPVTGTTTTTQATVEGPSMALTPPAAESATETTSYVNRPLLATGLVLLGGTYIASVAVAAESDRPSDRPNLYYPVAGPWIDLAQRDCVAALPCSGEAGHKALLILDGIGQGVGALALLTSFFVPEKKSRHWFFVGSKEIHASPASIGTGYGLAAVGQF